MTLWLSAAALVLGGVALASAERAVLARLARDRRPVDLQRRARRAGLLLLALGHVLLAQVALVLGGAVPGAPLRLPAESWAIAAGAVLLVAVAVAVAHPPRWSVLGPGVVSAVAQEVTFRGVLLALVAAALSGGPDAARGAVATAVAVTVSAVAFAASRWARGRSAVAVSAVAGLLLGAVTVLSGSVVVACVLHVSALVVVTALDRRGWRAPARAAAVPGGGCASHDPASPSCQGCPLATAAAVTTGTGGTAGTPARA